MRLTDAAKGEKMVCKGPSTKPRHLSRNQYVLAVRKRELMIEVRAVESICFYARVDMTRLLLLDNADADIKIYTAEKANYIKKASPKKKKEEMKKNNLICQG